MHNLGLAFYKLQEYEKCVNCMAEAAEIYATKYSMWFWMGAATIKNFVLQSSAYFMKSSNKAILTGQAKVEQIDEKVSICIHSFTKLFK